jgi:hypothetical protein
MQSKFREFLIHEVKSICRKFSRKAEASTSTDSFERINLSPDVLPSRELFGRLTNTKNRGFSYLEKLACIVAEIEVCSFLMVKII